MAEMNHSHHRTPISPPPSRKRKRTEVEKTEALPSHSDPPAHWLRVYSWNINGIYPFIQPSIVSYLTRSKHGGKDNDPSITCSLRSFLQRQHWPQVLQLQEVKINPTDHRTQKAVEKAVNLRGSEEDTGPQYVVRFCLPADKFNATGFGRKVYGVATIMRADFFEQEVEKVREVAWDVEGRVLVVETKSKLSIWNIYAVNGTTNPYRDPTSGAVVGTRHDRKLAFHKQLLNECKHLESRGYRVILAGDMNIARASIDGFPNLRTHPEQHVKNRFDFNTKFFEDPNGLHAIDSFRHLHPVGKKYTWIARNREWLACCDRVDLIILSRSLVERETGVLVEADILMTPADRGPSDHAPLHVALDLTPLTMKRGRAEDASASSFVP